MWLRGQVLDAIRRGDERGAIHQANLIPPGLLNDRPDVYLPYLILREHVIDRLYDQNVGYCQPDLQGLEHLTRADQAELLVAYLRPWRTSTASPSSRSSRSIDLARPDAGHQPRLITGHIDFLQARNGAIHIHDYKPDARTNKPIAQLTIYALARLVPAQTVILAKHPCIHRIGLAALSQSPRNVVNPNDQPTQLACSWLRRLPRHATLV